MNKIIDTKVEELLDPSLSCFSGEDGGITFVKLKILLTIFCERSDKGDNKAKDALNIIIKFNKLIKLANEML